MVFWLVPMYLVGFFNGLFLFYFPHYTTKLENTWRQKYATQTFNLINFLPKLGLNLIDISRIYHERHHDKVNDNRAYFPEIVLANRFWSNLQTHGWSQSKYRYLVEPNY
jgi:hypothetical protein